MGNFFFVFPQNIWTHEMNSFDTGTPLTTRANKRRFTNDTNIGYV